MISPPHSHFSSTAISCFLLPGANQVQDISSFLRGPGPVWTISEWSAQLPPLQPLQNNPQWLSSDHSDPSGLNHLGYNDLSYFLDNLSSQQVDWPENSQMDPFFELDAATSNSASFPQQPEKDQIKDNPHGILDGTIVWASRTSEDSEVDISRIQDTGTSLLTSDLTATEMSLQSTISSISDHSLDLSTYPSKQNNVGNPVFLLTSFRQCIDRWSYTPSTWFSFLISSSSPWFVSKIKKA